MVFIAALMAFSTSTVRVQPSAPTAAVEAAPAPLSGWAVEGASLLLYDSSGSVVSEVGLGHWEETTSERVSVLDITAGVSPDRRFGWIMEARTAWNPPRTRRLEDRRNFRFFGTAGAELWTSARAAKSDGAPLAAFSRDGEVLLLAVKNDEASSDKRWAVAVKSYLGNTVREIGPFPQLLGMVVAPSGRFGLVRWLDPDKSATHTVLDLKADARRDIPSEKFILGAARLEDDGKVYSGKRLIHDMLLPTYEQ